MKLMNTTEWIAHFLATEPPRSKSLVMTIFGDTIAPHGGASWLGSLIELQEGWLVARRDGRRSAYAIVPEALPRFERANRRIYAPLTAHWDGSWTLLLAAASVIDAPTRAQLRKELAWEGYALVAQGVYGHPNGSPDAIEEIVARAGVKGKLLVCRASELAGVSTRPLRELAAEGWDLAEVVQGYRQFGERFAPLLALLQEGEALAPEQAFVVRTLLIHAYRRVQLHDPMLPIELLPDPWPGSEAYALARALYRRTHSGAELHINAALQREDAAAPQADAAFYQRFGGLQ